MVVNISQKAEANNERIQKQNAKKFFQMLNKDTMDLVDDFYAEDIHFIDPVVELNNRDDLKHYYDSSYAKTESVSFEIPTIINDGDEQTVIWIMTMTAKKLNKGKPIIVHGSSHIRYNDQGRAVYHRDYFDMGEMIYSRVPLVRSMVNFVRNKMRKNHDPVY